MMNAVADLLPTLIGSIFVFGGATADSRAVHSSAGNYAPLYTANLDAFDTVSN